jgi:hypothetical protein
VGAAERKVVEANGEWTTVLLCPTKGFGKPAERSCGLALTEEEVAVLIALNPVEDRVFGLAFRLKLLGFFEEARGRTKVAGLMALQSAKTTDCRAAAIASATLPKVRCSSLGNKSLDSHGSVRGTD